MTVSDVRGYSARGGTPHAEPYLRPASILLLIVFVVEGQPSVSLGAAPVDQLTDLTGRASVIVTLTGRDNFANESRYDVRVKNQSATPLEADSLVVVLEQITDLAGKDALDRIEGGGQDGETAEKKPYFRMPVDGSALAAYGERKPVTVILKNAVYTIIFTPSFKVLGRLRLPPAASPDSVQSLVETLIEKGVLTDEEGAAISRRALVTQPTP